MYKLTKQDLYPRLEHVGGNEFRTSCPFCGDKKKHFYFNEEKGVYFCFLCEAKGRIADDTDPSRSIRINKTYVPSPSSFQKTSSAKPLQKPFPLKKINKVYSRLLNLLSLSKEHYKHLTQERMLKPDRARQYRTAAPDKIKTAVAKLAKEEIELEDVPGFYEGEDGVWHLCCPSGIIIPVKNPQGQIWGLQVRRDSSDNGPRYLWVSSRSKPKGTAAKALCHFEVPVSVGEKPKLKHFKKVWITEGPLKAAVACQYTNQTFVAVPGVNTWKSSKLIEILTKLKTKESVIAYDSDMVTNKNVLNAAVSLGRALKKSGIKVVYAVWDPEYKGIDDLFVAKKGLKMFNLSQWEKQMYAL